MADRDGVFIYVGIYSSETDARLDHEAVKVLRECEVGYYDAAAVTGFALHTAAATVADLSSTKHRQRELATRFGNFLQAFSHIGMLHSIFAISDARKQVQR